MKLWCNGNLVLRMWFSGTDSPTALLYGRCISIGCIVRASVSIMADIQQQEGPEPRSGQQNPCRFTAMRQNDRAQARQTHTHTHTHLRPSHDIRERVASGHVPVVEGQDLRERRQWHSTRQRQETCQTKQGLIRRCCGVPTGVPYVCLSVLSLRAQPGRHRHNKAGRPGTRMRFSQHTNQKRKPRAPQAAPALPYAGRRNNKQVKCPP